MMKIRPILGVLLALVIALGMVTLPGSEVAQAQAAVGYLRLTHAVTGGAAVDVYVGSNLAVSNLEFGKASALLPLPTGTHTLSVRAAGDKSNNNLLRGNVSIPTNEVIEAIVLDAGGGEMSLGTGRISLRNLNGKARVFVFHAAPNAPAVDVLANGSAVVTGLGFGRGEGVVGDVDAGTYNLAVTPTGQPDSVLLPLDGVELKANTVYTVVALATTGALVPLVSMALPIGIEPAPVGQNGFIRVTHASKGAPAVDIYLDEAAQPVVGNLAFGVSTDFLELPAKTYTIQVREADKRPIIFETTLELGAGQSLEVIALGVIGGEPAFGLNTYEVDRTNTEGKARIYAIHAAAEAGTVDLRANGKVVAAGAGFGTYTADPLVADAGIINIVATPAGKTSPVVKRLTQAELAADMIYTAIAIDGQDVPLLLTSAPIPDAAAGKTGKVRITHASKGAPNVDIYLDGSAIPAVTDLAFGSSTDFITLPAKEFSVAIRPAGQSPVNAPVYEGKITVPTDANAEVVAMGLLDGDPGFMVGAFPIDLSETAGKARVYVIHAAAGAGEVDVRVNGKAVVEGAAFGAFTTEALMVDAGIINVVATPAGKTSPVVKRFTQQELLGSTIYTLIFVDGQDAPVVLTHALPAGVRITHASEGAPNIDLYLNDVLIFSDLVFGGSTTLTTITQGTYQLALRPADAAADSAPVYATEIKIPAGTSLDLIVMGVLEGEPKLTVGTFPFDPFGVGDKARVYLIHAASKAGAVDVRINGETAIEGFEFGKTSDAVDLEPGIINITGTPAGKRSPVVVRLVQAELKGGTVYVGIVLDGQDVPALLEAAGK